MSNPPSPITAGRLLVARPALLDPNFVQTVILLAEHNDEGSLGFVLTRNSGATIGEVAEEFDVVERLEPVWIGGPVQTDSLWAVHQRPDLASLSREIVPGVWYGGSPPLVRALLDMPASDQIGFLLRLFAGYAGWGKGQLEDEVREGAWAVLPAFPAMYFGEGCDEIWEEMIRRDELPTARRPELLWKSPWN